MKRNLTKTLSLKGSKALRLGLGALLLGAVTMLVPTTALATPIMVSAGHTNLVCVDQGDPGPCESEKDERYHWDNDFNGAPLVDFLDKIANQNYSLSSVLLTLDLKALHYLVLSDEVQIVGIGGGGSDVDYYVEDPAFTTLPVGVRSTVLVELLNTPFNSLGLYTAQNILDSLTGGTSGVLNMKFSDDAIIYGTNLTLTATQTPEPASLFLLGSGLVGLAAWRMKKK